MIFWGSKLDQNTIMDLYFNFREYLRKYNFSSIQKAFLKVLKKSKKISNPFLKKNTPLKIAKKILSYKYNLKKNFYDI